jgi:hypothetical protein
MANGEIAMATSAHRPMNGGTRGPGTFLRSRAARFWARRNSALEAVAQAAHGEKIARTILFLSPRRGDIYQAYIFGVRVIDFPLGTALSNRNRAEQLVSVDTTGATNELARHVQLAPDVAQQNSAHSILGEIVDHALPVRLLPIGDRVE